MEKFGNIVSVNEPVLLCFYSESNEASVHMNPVLREIVSNLNNSVKVVKIDVNKNKELVKALTINGLPTLIIYKDKQIVWRAEGFHDSNIIAYELSKHI